MDVVPSQSECCSGTGWVLFQHSVDVVPASGTVWVPVRMLFWHCMDIVTTQCGRFSVKVWMFVLAQCEFCSAQCECYSVTVWMFFWNSVDAVLA